VGAAPQGAPEQDVAQRGQPQQPASKGARIGFLSSTLPRSARHFHAFEQRLRALGYVEGQNLAMEFRSAEGQAERLPALAAELVQLPSTSSSR
jgi:putative ABC transport system substrate-binding protein